MSIGEYIRNNGDEELAALLINWMLTILICSGLEYNQVDFSAEFYGLLDYLKQPISDEVIESFKLFISSSELQS